MVTDPKVDDVLAEEARIKTAYQAQNLPVTTPGLMQAISLSFKNGKDGFFDD